MKKIMRAKNKVTLLLLSAILLLCIGFIFIACGVGPTTKGINNDRGNFALDSTVCPGGLTTCVASAEATEQSYSMYSIQGKPLTLEAWIKPKATTTAFILRHLESKGAGLKFAGISDNTTQVTPIFEIRRSVLTVGGGGTTSSVPYTVSGSAIDLYAWTHIAGVLTNDTHAIGMAMDDGDGTTTAHPTCAATPGDGDATDDSWHIDLYINGVINACAPTYGTATDPTAAAVAFADAPGSKLVATQAQGIVDETRIWTTDDRTILDCMSQELGTSGTCDRTNTDLLSYLRFNAGSGSSVMDDAGIFGGAGLVYVLGPDNSPSWTTGWTTDTPF